MILGSVYRGPTIDGWHLVPHGDPPWVVFQLARNQKQNLNVAGNGPYPAGTLVYSYEWGGGQPNELWHTIELCYANGVLTSIGSSSFVVDDVTVHTNAFSGSDDPRNVVGQEIPIYVEGTRVGYNEMIAIRTPVVGRQD